MGFNPSMEVHCRQDLPYGLTSTRLCAKNTPMAQIDPNEDFALKYTGMWVYATTASKFNGPVIGFYRSPAGATYVAVGADHITDPSTLTGTRTNTTGVHFTSPSKTNHYFIEKASQLSHGHPPVAAKAPIDPEVDFATKHAGQWFQGARSPDIYGPIVGYWNGSGFHAGVKMVVLSADHITDAGLISLCNIDVQNVTFTSQILIKRFAIMRSTSLTPSIQRPASPSPIVAAASPVIATGSCAYKIGDILLSAGTNDEFAVMDFDYNTCEYTLQHKHTRYSYTGQIQKYVEDPLLFTLLVQVSAQQVFAEHNAGLEYSYVGNAAITGEVVGWIDIPGGDPRILLNGSACTQNGTKLPAFSAEMSYVFHTDLKKAGTPHLTDKNRGAFPLHLIAIKSQNHLTKVQKVTVTAGPLLTSNTVNGQPIAAGQSLHFIAGPTGWTQTVKNASEAKKLFSSGDDKYPHECPKCGSKAYIGFSKVDCYAGCK